MTVKGIVKKGKVILDGPSPFGEGARVTVRAVRARTAKGGGTDAAAFLLRHAGKIKSGYPRDLSKNHDHYLYGVPKKR